MNKIIRRLLCAIFITSCTVQSVAALTLPENAVVQFVVDHSAVLKNLLSWAE